jgi:hypothetical protein
MRDDRRVQDSDDIWRRGGVSGMPDKINTLIFVLKMSLAKTAVAATSGACSFGLRRGPIGSMLQF